MSLFSLPFALELTLQDSQIERPDGGVPIPIDGQDLLRRVGVTGHLDFDSIRVEQPGVTLRDTPVQFVPDADFDPVRSPRGTLWIRLYKQTWEDRSFPRRFIVRFDRLHGGGKKPWQRDLDQPGRALRLMATPRSASIHREDGALALGVRLSPQSQARTPSTDHTSRADGDRAIAARSHVAPRRLVRLDRHPL